MSREADIILYDGVCGLCNRLNQFVLRRDPEGKFRFASLQSGFAREVLGRHGKDPRDLDTLYVVVDPGRGERLLAKSAAAAYVLRRLGGVWAGLGTVVGMLPVRLGDRAYDVVARNRYRLFGRYDTCLLPRPEHTRRFIEV